MRALVLYTAGPYTGEVEQHIAQAKAVAVRIWEQGHIALCPHLNTANFEAATDKISYDQYIAGDLRLLELCDGLVLLPDWQKSKGAKIEYGFAMQNDKPVWIYPDLPPSPDGRTDILEKAWQLTEGPRRHAYGHALDDFTRTGKLWGEILGLKQPLLPEQVGMCMIAVKLSRQTNRHKVDNLVDIAGYANTIMQVYEERARRLMKATQMESPRSAETPNVATHRTHDASHAPAGTPSADQTAPAGSESS